MIPVGPMIKEMLRERGIRQEDFAAAIYMTKPGINPVLNGLYDVNTTRLQQFARYFDMKPSELLQMAEQWVPKDPPVEQPQPQRVSVLEGLVIGGRR